MKRYLISRNDGPSAYDEYAIQQSSLRKQLSHRAVASLIMYHDAHRYRRVLRACTTPDTDSKALLSMRRHAAADCKSPTLVPQWTQYGRPSLVDYFGMSPGASVLKLVISTWSRVLTSLVIRY